MTDYLRCGLKYGLLAIVILALAPQPHAKAAPPSKDAKVYQAFFEVTGARQHYRQMKSMLIRQSQQNFIIGLQKTLPLQKDITDQQQKKIMPLIKAAYNSYISGLEAELDRIMPYETVVSKIYTPAFAKQFSIAELKKITEFYSSPTGKKFIANLPTLMQGSFETVKKQYTPLLNSSGKKLAQSELGKLKEKVDRELAPGKEKPKTK